MLNSGEDHIIERNPFGKMSTKYQIISCVLLIIVALGSLNFAEGFGKRKSTFLIKSLVKQHDDGHKRLF